jgi:hypothetical protein
MAAATNTGAAILESLRPELEKAFRDIPAFGSVGFEVHFVDGYPSRIEYSASLSRKVPTKLERSRP